MRMTFAVQMDRPINLEHHIITPGGYAMTFSNGRSMEFDFYNSNCSVSADDNTILCCDVSYLDTDDFPCAAGLRHFQGSILRIDEFFIYTGEHSDPEIHPVKLLELHLYNDDAEEIVVDDNVLDCGGALSDGR